MKVAAHKVILPIALIALIGFSVSCVCSSDRATTAGSGTPPTEKAQRVAPDKIAPGYGQPGPDSIRVYVGGPYSENPGLYYLKSGATLESALSVSDNLEHNTFGRRLWVYNLADGTKAKKLYHSRHLSASEKAEVLHDKDCLFFPCTLW
jgi:hypothetical protein